MSARVRTPVSLYLATAAIAAALIASLAWLIVVYLWPVFVLVGVLAVVAHRTRKPRPRARIKR